ncbi:hypothetical protein D3C76_833990 [compost metagenome]
MLPCVFNLLNTVLALIGATILAAPFIQPPSHIIPSMKLPSNLPAFASIIAFLISASPLTFTGLNSISIPFSETKFSIAEVNPPCIPKPLPNIDASSTTSVSQLAGSTSKASKSANNSSKVKT